MARANGANLPPPGLCHDRNVFRSGTLSGRPGRGPGASGALGSRPEQSVIGCTAFCVSRSGRTRGDLELYSGPVFCYSVCCYREQREDIHVPT